MGLSPQQRAFALDTSPVSIAHGSIRSSKTTGQIIGWLDWLRTAPAGPLAIVGRTRDTAGRNILDVIEQLEPSIISWRFGAPTATIMGRLHHVLGANDSKAEAKVRGLTLAGALVDEVTLLPENLFVTLLGRLSVDGARLVGTTNPDSPHHWLKTGYLDRAHHLGWSVYHFTLADNPSLSPAYIERTSRAYTGVFYDRFIRGLWVSAEGAIFSSWSEAEMVVPWSELPPMRDILAVGIDYGTTNPSAAIVLGLSAEMDERGRPAPRLYLMDEWRYDPAEHHRRLTDEEQSASLRAWLDQPHHPATSTPPRHIVIDPAAASFRVQLERDGIRNIRSGVNAVAYGIGLVASGLGAGWLRVSDRCTGFISEAPGYVWDVKATARGDDEPVEVNDHSLDAARYAVATTEALWRSSIDARAV